MADTKECQYPNCTKEAVDNVARKDLCAEHAEGFRAFITDYQERRR